MLHRKNDEGEFRVPEVEEFRTNLDEAKTPLGKGGVAAPSKKMARRHRV